jgi:iduronate 2-sulfatase
MYSVSKPRMILIMLVFWMPLVAVSSMHHFLMIASDDMRPEMSPYGHEYMHTPNFQQLADDGFVFRRAYVQQALCAPSRTVLLTGRRPDTSRVVAIGPYFRNTTLKDVKTLPQYFKENGYRCMSMGKIYHEGAPSGLRTHFNKSLPVDHRTVIDEYDQDYPMSWSEIPYHPPVLHNHWNKTNPCPNETKKDGHCRGAPLSNGPLDGPIESFNDYQSMLRGVEWIKNASQYDKPFFLAVGFHRPHIPYVYPKQFEKYYPNESVKFPPDDYYITKHVPPMAPHDWTGEGAGYKDLYDLGCRQVENFKQNLSAMCTMVPYWKQREMKRSYFACITYIDFLVGKLTDALKEESLYNSTTIIFWGDHGYKLGEHCDWFKHDNYEDSTRIPVIVKPATGLFSLRDRGTTIEQLVEEVDIFPSLAEIAGFDKPSGVEGESWLPLLKASGTVPAGKARVFSQYPHGQMGYSMRTGTYRYTEWCKFSCLHSVMDPMKCNESFAPLWDTVQGVELYNHTGDKSGGSAESFGKWENTNLANSTDPAVVALVKQLSEELHANWAPIGPPPTSNRGAVAAP